MGLFGYTTPCALGDAASRDERLSLLVDDADADPRLVAHLAGCAECSAALSALKAQQAALIGLGDVPGAAPNDAELRQVLRAVANERERSHPRLWLGWAAATATIVVLAGGGARYLLVQRTRAADDAAILSSADAAFRRAEREYGDAVSLLHAQLDKVPTARTDARLAEGARALEEARVKAAVLVAEKRGDPEREALLRDALRAQVRYYEDALMRTGTSPETAPGSDVPR